MIHRLASSWRERPPQQTLSIAQALMPALGISRVTDITRLDRLGLPVFASIRPRSNGLRVTAGKGLSAAEARASAVMEAIEHAVAEPQRTPWTRRRLSWARIADQFDEGASLVDLVPRAEMAVTRRTMLTTVGCERLGRAEEPIDLPAELVFYPYPDPSEAQRFFVSTTTNGLASGNSVTEATLHALFEVLERDALAMNRPRDASQWVDRLPPPFDTFARDWHALGIELSVRHVPNEFGLPCFQAVLNEPQSTDVNLAAGHGLHPDRGLALARAICEAAQSRACTIHGGRDDLVRFYAKYTQQAPAARLAMERDVIRDAFDTTRRIDFDALPHHPRGDRSLAELLDETLASMRRAGLPSVFRYRFDVDLAGLHVVKLIVPKSEIVDPDVRRIGRRLLQRVIAPADRADEARA